MSQQWQDYHTGLVKQLKQLSTNLPTLAIPERGDQLIVETDASHKYWGGVLKAKKNDNKEHVCRYANGCFKPTEINYHSNEKELLALKTSFSKFHFFILPVKFLVRTNNTRNISLILNISKEKIIILAGKPTAKMTATSSQTDLKTMIEMAIRELCIAQEKINEIHSAIYEEIHPRIN